MTEVEAIEQALRVEQRMSERQRLLKRLWKLSEQEQIVAKEKRAATPMSALTHASVPQRPTEMGQTASEH